MEELHPDPQKGQLQQFALEFKQQVVGQPGAIEKLTDCLSKLLAGINNPECPLLTMLFLGPTGVGKTETVRSLARIFFGDNRAFTRINCQEYSAHFNLSKLLGSPPGYVGGEIKPLLCQENLEQHCLKAWKKNSGLVSQKGSLVRDVLGQKGKTPLSLVLFDEVEKAHSKLWDLLLGVLEDGSLVLANNEETDFRHSIIILTSNVGSKIMGSQLGNETIGFSSGATSASLARDVDEAAKRAARKIFPIEFLNRFDSMLTFNPLGDDELVRILDIQISDFHRRTMTCPTPFLVQVSPRARVFLIRHQADPALGARPVKRALDTLVVTPLSHMVIQGKINNGDLLLIDSDGTRLKFLRHQAGASDSLESNIKPPAIRWIKAEQILSDGGEEEDITEEVQKFATNIDSEIADNSIEAGRYWIFEPEKPE